MAYLQFSVLWSQKGPSLCDLKQETSFLSVDCWVTGLGMLMQWHHNGNGMICIIFLSHPFFLSPPFCRSSYLLFPPNSQTKFKRNILGTWWSWQLGQTHCVFGKQFFHDHSSCMYRSYISERLVNGWTHIQHYDTVFSNRGQCMFELAGDQMCAVILVKLGVVFALPWFHTMIMLC
jgi:hypothetical protein